MSIDLGCSLVCETPGSERRAHVPTANELDAHSPPDQDDWLGRAQCCSRVTFASRDRLVVAHAPGLVECKSTINPLQRPQSQD